MLCIRCHGEEHSKNESDPGINKEGRSKEANANGKKGAKGCMQRMRVHEIMICKHTATNEGPTSDRVHHKVISSDSASCDTLAFPTFFLYLHSVRDMRLILVIRLACKRRCQVP